MDCINTALSVGYRHIDTAQMYDNEAYIGRAIEMSDIDRDELFVATKIHPKNLGYEGTIRTTKQSLDRLTLETIDLLYIHWPLMNYDVKETCAAFNDLQEEGLIKHIGLSNFTPSLLREVISELESSVFAHQIEMHPLLQQDELVEIAQEYGHNLVAYSPLARGKVFENKTISQVAEKHGTSPAQVSIAWLCEQPNVVPIPSSTQLNHMQENYRAQQLTLDEEDKKAITDITTQERIVELDYEQEFE